MFISNNHWLQTGAPVTSDEVELETTAVTLKEAAGKSAFERE